MATLYGGPASGLHIPDDSRDLEYVAVTLDDNGRPIPDQPVEGRAQTLPDDPDTSTELLLAKPRKRWECYRKIGARIPGMEDIGPLDDLPIPTEGPAYRWVCHRREA